MTTRPGGGSQTLQIQPSIRMTPPNNCSRRGSGAQGVRILLTSKTREVSGGEGWLCPCLHKGTALEGVVVTATTWADQQAYIGRSLASASCNARWAVQEAKRAQS